MERSDSSKMEHDLRHGTTNGVKHTDRKQIEGEANFRHGPSLSYWAPLMPGGTATCCSARCRDSAAQVFRLPHLIANVVDLVLFGTFLPFSNFCKCLGFPLLYYNTNYRTMLLSLLYLGLWIVPWLAESWLLTCGTNLGASSGMLLLAPWLVRGQRIMVV